MRRSILIALCLVAMGGPLPGQETFGGARSADGRWVDTRTMPKVGGTLIDPAAARFRIPPPPRSRVSEAGDLAARIECPRRMRAVKRRALIGVVIGGLTGFALAENLPSLGVDVPAAVLYVPLFAVPSGVIGALTAAYWTPCGPSGP